MNDGKIRVRGMLARLGGSDVLKQCLSDIRSLPDSYGDDVADIKASAAVFTDLCKKADQKNRGQAIFSYKIRYFPRPDEWIPDEEDFKIVKNFQTLIQDYSSNYPSDDPIVKLQKFHMFDTFNEVIAATTDRINGRA